MKFYGILKRGKEEDNNEEYNENNFCSWEETFCANCQCRMIFYWRNSKFLKVQAYNGSADTISNVALQTG